jgi:hypothetical protein
MFNNTSFSPQVNGNLTHFHQPHSDAQRAEDVSHQPIHHKNSMLVLANGLQSAHNASLSPEIRCSSKINLSRSSSNSRLTDFSNRILQKSAADLNRLIMQKSAADLNRLIMQKNHARENLLHCQRQVDIFTQQFTYWKNYLSKLSSEFTRNLSFLDKLENESLPAEISDHFLSRKQQELKAAKANLIIAKQQYKHYDYQSKEKQEDHENTLRLLQ